MKLLLLKCKICDYWHNPEVHDGHCPVCGTIQWIVQGRHITINTVTGKSIARGMPRDYTNGRCFA